MDTLSVSNITKNSSGLSAYFAEQFASLTPMKVVIALALGFLVGVIIGFFTPGGCAYAPNAHKGFSLYSAALPLGMMAFFLRAVLFQILGGQLPPVEAVLGPSRPGVFYGFLGILFCLCILLGAELYVIALVVVLGISVVLFLMTFVKFTNPNAYLLVLHYDEEAEYDINQQLRRMVKQRRLRSKTVTRTGAEMTFEVRLDNKQDLVAAMLNIDGVHDATLVACQSEAGA